MTSVDGSRRMFIPSDLTSTFLRLASSNTRQNLETCGILTGKLVSLAKPYFLLELSYSKDMKTQKNNFATLCVAYVAFFRILFFLLIIYFPANICLFKVKYRNGRESCEICSKLSIKKPERHYCPHSGFFIVNFEHILHLFPAFLLLTLIK